MILQGVLGGLRVTLLKDEIGIFHACLAQVFFGIVDRHHARHFAIVAANFRERFFRSAPRELWRASPS